MLITEASRPLYRNLKRSNYDFFNCDYFTKVIMVTIQKNYGFFIQPWLVYKSNYGYFTKVTFTKVFFIFWLLLFLVGYSLQYSTDNVDNCEG